MQFSFRSRSQAIASLVDTFEATSQKFSTGLPSLDRAMGGGLHTRKLYGFQARKKIGKSIVMGTISYNLNMAGVRHLWINCEMSDFEIEERHLSRAIGCNPLAFAKHKDGVLKERIARVRQDIPDNILYFDDFFLRLNDLPALVETAVEDYGIKGFFLDYYQRVRGGDGENRVQHLEDVAATLSALARKHGLFSATAAQLNTEGNTRGGEGLKMAADQVWTLHREKGSAEAWLELEDTRYTPYVNVGSKRSPGLLLDSRGLYLKEWEPSKENEAPDPIA